jgi:hypothetical protein
MKKFLIGLMTCVVLMLPLSSVSADYFDDNAVNVVLNGEPVEFSPKAIVHNGNTMVSFRQLFEAYGANVGWNQETRSVTATKGDITIKLTQDSFKALVNDKEYKLTQTPYIAKDTLLINLRFVSEALGAEVKWQKNPRTVFITWVDEESDTPKGTLKLYFDALNKEDFDSVTRLYGGSYETLQGYNPNIDANNMIELMKSYCTINGGQIVNIDKIVSEEKKSEEEYIFKLTLKNKDGTPFQNGKKYNYTVKNIEGHFTVLDLPPYLS